MRREGRVTGNLRIKHNTREAAKAQYEQEMQDLGFSGPFNYFDVDYPGVIKVLNKPTNESKFSGRCRGTACPKCHDAPFSKALCKTKGLRNKSWRRTCKPSVDSDLQDYVDAFSDVYYEGYDIHSVEDMYVAGVIHEDQHEAGCDDDGDGHDMNRHYPIMDQQGSLLRHHSVESAS